MEAREKKRGKTSPSLSSSLRRDSFDTREGNEKGKTGGVPGISEFSRRRGDDEIAGASPELAFNSALWCTNCSLSRAWKQTAALFREIRGIRGDRRYTSSISISFRTLRGQLRQTHRRSTTTAKKRTTKPASPNDEINRACWATMTRSRDAEFRSRSSTETRSSSRPADRVKLHFGQSRTRAARRRKLQEFG